MTKKPIPVVLDTDIGDDIDDALALSLLLNSPEVELRGVTTVFRDAPLRAKLAVEVLKGWNRVEIPVHAGASDPLLIPYSQIPGGVAVGRQFERLESGLPEVGGVHGVEFLAQSVREAASNGEILTILAIGPMTNIALFVSTYPDLAAQARLVMMAGHWSQPQPEWNILCDPEASAIVFAQAHKWRKKPRMVGIDVTHQVVLTPEEEARFAASPKPVARYLGDLIALWGHKVTLHDPLAALTLWSDIVEFAPRQIAVNLSPEFRSHTQIIEGQANCEVATTVNVEAAKSQFLERVLDGVATPNPNFS